jgi:hypothetical protein
VAELVTAGVEGGRKGRIEKRWGLADYRELKAHWAEHIPPHTALIFMGAALGVKWEKVREALQGGARPMDELPAVTGPSIRELGAKIMPPAAGGSLPGATVRALRDAFAPPQVEEGATPPAP